MSSIFNKNIFKNIYNIVLLKRKYLQYCFVKKIPIFVSKWHRYCFEANLLTLLHLITLIKISVITESIKIDIFYITFIVKNKFNS